MPKAFQLIEPTIKELSLVFARKDGSEWAPRNTEARVLSVKGEKSKIAQAIDVIKSYFVDGDASGYPVAQAADNIDHDGDGPSDYNAICSAICNVFYDLQAAMGISDNQARSSAIVSCIDAFLAGLDAMRSGKDDDTQKSGARHSAADTETLGKIASAHANIENHMAAIAGALKDLGVTGAEGPVEGETGAEQDDGPNNSQDPDGAEKAKKPKGEYGSEDDAGYADPGYQEDKRPRYPMKRDGELDKERVKAAWGFINHEDNAKLYSDEDLAKVKDTIRAAAKEVGIKIADDSKKGDIDMTQDELKALVSDAATKAAEAVKSDLQPQIDAAKADAQTAIAESKRQEELAASYKAQADQNAAVLAAVSGTSAKSSALSATVAVQKSSLQARMIAEMRNNPEPTPF